jgi:type VII secretion integral membrane protein EccD
MTAQYSRVTVVGARRRVDTVLPSDEPVARLIPDLLALLAEPAFAPPRLRQLVTGRGDVLAADATLAGSGVLDGHLLRLVAAQDSPPAPVVHDVAEEAADDLDRRGRRWAVTLLAVVWSAAGAALVHARWPGLLGAVELAGLAMVAAAAGVSLVRWREPVGTAVLCCSAVLGLAFAWSAGRAANWPAENRWILLAATATGLLAVLGAATPLGRAALFGGGVGLGLVTAWYTGLRLGLTAERTAAVLAVLAVVALGVLPRLALSAAGLSRLDDARVAGREVSRREVGATLADTHRGLVLAVVAVAGSAAVSGAVLASGASPWSVGLAGLLGVLVVSRGRALPLLGEVLATGAAATAIGVALLAAWAAGHRTSGGPLAVVGAGLLGTLVVLAWNPSAHARARARRIADRAEAVLVVAVLPVAVGVFGSYGRLLHAF